MPFCLVYSHRERLGICQGYDSYPLFSHLALMCHAKVHLLHLNLSVTYRANTSIYSSFLNLLNIFSKLSIFGNFLFLGVNNLQWNMKLQKCTKQTLWLSNWTEKNPKCQKAPLLCCEHSTKVTDVCSPETILSAPLPALCLQRSALLLHPSAYIKLTSCWSLKLMET